MSTGILLITHSGIGSAFLNVAHEAFGKLPLKVTELSVPKEADPDDLINHAVDLVKSVNSGSGVLVLTDMFGATPSNIAQGLQREGYTLRVVTGLNLPMLFRVLNYPKLALHQLAKKAIDGGREGVFEAMTHSRCIKRNWQSTSLIE